MCLFNIGKERKMTIYPVYHYPRRRKKKGGIVKVLAGTAVLFVMAYALIWQIADHNYWLGMRSLQYADELRLDVQELVNEGKYQEWARIENECECRAGGL